MRRTETVFADNGTHTVRHYRPGRPPVGETRTWRGMCLERRTPQSSEHVFADGTDLLLDWPTGMARPGAPVVGAVRSVLAESAAVSGVASGPDHALDALSDRCAVTLTWARLHQRVAVGGLRRLVTDERRMCTVEITVPGRPACSEVVRWDETDTAGGLREVEAATDRVRALAALPQTDLPAVRCDLVLDPGRAGAFFHELVGHPLEADIVAGNASCLAGLMGERVAPTWLSVADGTAPEGDGLGAVVDDEGTPVGTAELIAEGRVAGVLSDLSTAALTGTTGNGHGRRLDYRHPVVPRMWHTDARAVGVEPEPPGALRLTPRGIRLRWMNLLTGDFEFAVDTALLDTGEGPPVRVGPCAVNGNALTVLAALRPGPSVSRSYGRATRGCGKLGQYPLVTTFANSGMWVPAEAVDVRSDPAV
ncbi:metallopeptidase TldD-related protein [Streptomyces sp. NPDC086519]|uniref:metallopeptidase TldD-related protein n=1 Tax=Streptomyces sp. NPDC086519 TaxID=3154863 RepID=UPI003427209F